MEALTATLLVLAGLHVTSEVEGVEADVASHLRHLATHRYPNKKQEEARKWAVQYITECFEEYGLRVDYQLLHAFASPDPSHTTCPDDTFKNTCLSHVEGVNVIGMSGQERDETGAVVLVGAAYDTKGVGSPVHDNGAGVAVLLETARLYQGTAPRPRLATLFVAFDLNVEGYEVVGGGIPGGWNLVQDYVRSFVAHNISRFGGAIVLGPLMNVNHQDHSQRFSARLQELFPAAHEVVAAGGHKGDFLAMVTRGAEGDEAALSLGRQVAESYKEVGGKLVELSLGNRSHSLLPPTLPPRQAAHFWGSTHNGMLSPLPAVLLTDTERNRKWPPDPHAEATHLTEAQQVFLDTTVTSLVHFLVRRQAVEDWWETGLLVALLASCMVNLLLMLQFRHLCTSTHADKERKEGHCSSQSFTLKDAKYAACSSN